MKTTKTLFILGIILCLLIPFTTIAQWSQNTIQHDGIQRQYWIYVSPNYDANTPASLIVTLHGMGDDATNFRGINFNDVADTANVIILVPDALVDGLTGMTAWNSSAGVDLIGVSYYPNSNINDVDFINTIVNETIANYSIEATKTYVCGFSMGGFMTQKLALEANSPFAAFASVAGTFGSGLTISNPGRTIPIAHFHGTEDGTVGYDNNMFGSNVQDLVDFWVDNNNCDATPIHTFLPDNYQDGFTVEHFLYDNGDNNTVVELFKVNNAGHIWLHEGVHDISYTGEIWNFFNRHTHQNLSIDEEKKYDFTIYPNPTSGVFTIKSDYAHTQKISIKDLNGKEVYNGDMNGITQIDVSALTVGLYFVEIGNTVQKIVVQ